MKSVCVWWIHFTVPLSTPSAHFLEHLDALESTINTFSCEYPIFILTVLISSPLLDEIFVEDLSTHWFIKCSVVYILVQKSKAY